MHEHIAQAYGHKTRFICSQDSTQKAKFNPSTRSGAKPRDTVGMKRFPCASSLNIACRSTTEGEKMIRVYLQHKKAHEHYYDVSMPEAALKIIRDNLAIVRPSDLVTTIQQRWDNITASQIYSAWAKMSETTWKRCPEQLPSARALLEEYPDEVEVFTEISPPVGVEQLCFGLKRVLNGLRGKIVEIGLDATCENTHEIVVNNN